MQNEFRASQIVYLKHLNTSLYARVIQVVAERQLCWVRPLMLAIAPEELLSDSDQPEVIDLRMSSDLLWPIDLFEPAVDTETISLLIQLKTIDFANFDEDRARACLHRFIQGFWQSRNSTE